MYLIVNVCGRNTMRESFPTFETFCQVTDQCTGKFMMLVINNNAKSNKLSDQVFWYKADLVPILKLGQIHIGYIQKIIIQMVY